MLPFFRIIINNKGTMEIIERTRIFSNTSEYHNGIKKGDYYGVVFCTYDHTNGLIYVGQTIRVNQKSYIGSGPTLSKAIKEKGKENFSCWVLDYADCQNVLDSLEKGRIGHCRVVKTTRCIR